jgi:hypothetical protein
MAGASRRGGVGQGEALAAWCLWALMAAAVLATYARVEPFELYHVSREGLAGGASRALVLANFPISLVAIALVLIAAAALPRRAWWLAAPAIALCAVTAWPGVVDQGDLDARPVNVLPALGVALALVLTVAAVRRAGPGFAPPLPGDAVRLVLAVIVLVASLPWLSAELGYHLPGNVFLGEEVPAGETLAAVHLGHHHGTDGALLLLTALFLSRVRPAGALRPWLTGYVGLMAAYGAVNATQDLWTEQVFKRGWVAWRIPSALEPRLEAVWIAVLLLAVGAAALIHVEQRRGRPALPA